MRILLVEDDALLADGLTRALRHSGYVVDWTKDGRQADQWLADNEYDLSILDLGLPGLDGTEVLQRLRSRHQPTPVLILSAREALEERVKVLDMDYESSAKTDVEAYTFSPMLALTRAFRGRYTSTREPKRIKP